VIPNRARCSPRSDETGDFHMRRLTLGLAAISSSLFTCAAAMVLLSPVMAFDMGTARPQLRAAVRDPGPDEKPLPAPLTLPKLEGDQTPSQTGSGTRLQLTPETDKRKQHAECQRSAAPPASPERLRYASCSEGPSMMANSQTLIPNLGRSQLIYLPTRLATHAAKGLQRRLR